MITSFKIFESTEGRVFDFEENWYTYLNNFEKIHPEIKLRSKDKDLKTIINEYDIDISDFLIDRKVKFFHRNKNTKLMKIIGKIKDVRLERYDKYTTNVIQLFVRINNDWYKPIEKLTFLDNIYKTEIEEQLDLLIAINKFNI